MKLLSIQVGLPREVEWQGARVCTGIFKSPVPGPVAVRALGLAGDGQADLKHHGGLEKAVYAFGYDAYPWWRKELGRDDLGYGAFGENLTFSALDERRIGIGDVFALGSCRLQVTQPRTPCFKLGIRLGDESVLKTFMRSGRPGIYFRVVQEGEIRSGDEMHRVIADPHGVALWDMWEAQTGGYHDRALLQRLLGVGGLPADWRAKIERKLAQ